MATITPEQKSELLAFYKKLTSDKELAPILHLIPSFTTLTFQRPPESHFPSPSIAIYLGIYGDSHVYATACGSVYKQVFRTSTIRSAGTVIMVNQSMARRSWKDVPAPFFWDTKLQNGMYSPLQGLMTALVRLFCWQWVMRQGFSECLGLAVPEWEETAEVLRALKRAVESEKLIPKGLRTIEVAKDKDKEKAEGGRV
jgi:hypothetical protein